MGVCCARANSLVRLVSRLRTLTSFFFFLMRLNEADGCSELIGSADVNSGCNLARAVLFSLTKAVRGGAHRRNFSASRAQLIAQDMGNCPETILMGCSPSIDSVTGH